MSHPRCAADGGSIHEWAADEYKTGTECKRLQHIPATSDSAIHHHDQIASNRITDRRQHMQWLDGAIQLPAAMVRDDDSVRANRCGASCIVDMEDALDHQIPTPAIAYAGDVRP